jgi:hypothetical protein
MRYKYIINTECILLLNYFIYAYKVIDLFIHDKMYEDNNRLYVLYRMRNIKK